MKYISEEYLQKLQDELELVVMTISNTQGHRWVEYVQSYGLEIATAAVKELNTRKLVLLMQIDTISRQLKD